MRLYLKTIQIKLKSPIFPYTTLFRSEDPGAADLHSMGTVARIVKLLKMGEDNYSLVVQGLARFRVVELVQERSEEHTSELQSRRDLVCRLLLENKKSKDYSKQAEITN